MKKVSEKLFDKLIELGLQPKTIPTRIRTGYWQRSSGVWKWCCFDEFNVQIGSQNTMIECLKSKNINLLSGFSNTQVEVIVEND